MRKPSSRLPWTRSGTVLVAVVMLVSLAACSRTVGPTVRIEPTGWTADAPSLVQPIDRFSFVVDNSLDVDVEFVLLRMDYGHVADLPLANGVVDLSRQGTKATTRSVPSYPESGEGTRLVDQL